MTRDFRELQLNRGFGELQYLFRICGVNEASMGYEPLVASCMSYLHDSTLEFNQLIQIGFKNSPDSIRTIEECFEAMKDALQNLHTGHFEKVLDDIVVYTFIQNVTAEVRMREILRMRVLNNDLNANEEAISIVLRLAIRQIMKPEDDFPEILNHTSGKMGYTDAKELIYKSYPIVANTDIKSVIQKATENIQDPREKAITQKELLIPYQKEIQEIIKNLIDNYLNLHF